MKKLNEQSDRPALDRKTAFCQGQERLRILSPENPDCGEHKFQSVIATSFRL